MPAVIDIIPKVANQKNKKNDSLAPKLPKNKIKSIQQIFIFIGKPFYYLASFLFVILLFTVNRVLHSFPKKQRVKKLLSSFKKKKNIFYKKLFAKFAKTKKGVIKKTKKVRLIYPKYKLPKISLQKIHFAKFRSVLAFPHKLIRLSFLKVKLIFLKISSFAKKVFHPKMPGIFVFLVFLVFFIFWITILKGLPSPTDLTNRKQQVSTKIYDRNGILLYNIYKDENRSLVTLEEIPLHVQLATLAIEDAEFYNHAGFSVRGILRAFLKNSATGQLSGGSTITQQLVKNTLLTSEKTLTRKIKELILAISIEYKFTKDQILEMYLNEVSYGGTAYGIQEASRVYFDKDVSSLSLAEASLLAGLPKSPSKYSPFGANPESAKGRQEEVLNLMVINGYISRSQANVALSQELKFAENKTDIRAPHFVMYTKQQLENTYGKEMVEQGGLSVTTTLDYNIQLLAEAVIAEEIEKLTPLNVTNGAAVVIDPNSGEILAMVGSKNYFDTESQGNVNVTTSLRQPGSSIKVVNYALALSNGFTPASIIDDTKTTFSIPGLPPYTPKNYDGAYRGKISIRSALAESRNIPAVKLLANLGVNNMIDLGTKMGITTWGDPENYGLSLTLGGGEVKLLDLAQVYSALANYGVKKNVSAIKKITNNNGEIITENICSKKEIIKTALAAQVETDSCESERVLDEKVAFLITDILKDNVARSPAFGTMSQLVIPNHPEVAVKTGTSNNLRDNLAIGYTKDYVVAIWVGNNDNSPMSRVASGVTGASPIFNKIMTALLVDKESVEWPVPDGLVKLSICTSTGTLPCTGCPTRPEWFIESTVPTKYCTPEQISPVKPEDQVKVRGRILNEAARTKRQ